MNELKSFSQMMRTRRSVRAFSSQRVDDEIIKQALEVANSAPSGANLQPWFFTVIDCPAEKMKFREEAERIERDFYERRAPEEWKQQLEKLNTNSSKEFLTQASHLIIIFSRSFIETELGRQKTYFPLESTGLATGFLLCALTQAGLATLTYTPKPASFLNGLCGRERTDHPFMVIAVGYACPNYQAPHLIKKPLHVVMSSLTIEQGIFS